MQEDILINWSPQETRVALVENGVLQELHVERTHERGLVGNGIAEEREKRPGIFHVVVAPSGGVVGQPAGGEHHPAASGVDGLGDAQFAEGEGPVEFRFGGF